MSQPRYPNFARIGSGARRAMWKELELFWTGNDEAKVRHVEQRRAFAAGESLTFPSVDLNFDSEDETVVFSSSP